MVLIAYSHCPSHVGLRMVGRNKPGGHLSSTPPLCHTPRLSGPASCQQREKRVSQGTSAIGEPFWHLVPKVWLSREVRKEEEGGLGGKDKRKEGGGAGAADPEDGRSTPARAHAYTSAHSCTHTCLCSHLFAPSCTLMFAHILLLSGSQVNSHAHSHTHWGLRCGHKHSLIHIQKISHDGWHALT